jgi:hypothetical protein
VALIDPHFCAAELLEHIGFAVGLEAASTAKKIKQR